MINGLKIPTLTSWLNGNVTESADKSYRHNLLSEDSSSRKKVVKKLKPVIEAAHNDAKFRLRKAFVDDLDPLAEWNHNIDPAAGYPEVFDMTTLKGYFGEFFAGLLAENFSPFDESDWKVPIFYFRFHETAFDQLEMYQQTGEIRKAIVGRTGDDCLAFVLDGNEITKILFCEAKCTATHDTAMISEAHSKISSKNLVPVEIRRIIEIFQDYETETTSNMWIAALRNLYLNGGNTPNYERFDLVSYVCGQSPIRKRPKMSWISPDEPHQNYTGYRKLEVVEIQISEVEKLIKELYGKDV